MKVKKIIKLMFSIILFINIFTLTSCNKESVGLDFALSKGGESYSVIGIGTCEDEKIVIPSVYNGLPVKIIEEEAFKDCTNIKEIKMPDSITTIGRRAFQDCINLVKIKISKNLKYINERVFAGCKSLTKVTIPEGITIIGTGAFSSCEKLKSIKIPNSVTTIKTWAFSNCENLMKIKIPSSVTTMEGLVFSDCQNLTIYCEAESLPSGWDSVWCGLDSEVVWKGKKPIDKNKFEVKYKKDNFVGKQVEELSEEMYIEISKAYAKSNFSESGLSIVHYYGEYDGAYVVSTLISAITLEESKSLEIGGIKFPDCPDIVIVRVYKNGYVYTLEEAYIKYKTIDIDDLKKIKEQIETKGYL